ncbi:acyltransferase [Rufibacter sp. XAAS-G3-1]|uniref:acyltransferase n=1 Tax=Rufibacter sp. XAAS-G3-1 TaxID=2729134 RepID=UPI0015E76F3C|nr:acyltransferase [Rufibacter sp. XAAS-G3-1]
MNLKSHISELRLYIANRWVSSIPSHYIRLWFYQNIMKFRIGMNSNIFMDCTFDCTQHLSIGNNSVVNSKCRIDPRGKVFIGNNVSISSEVIILTADHDMENNMNGRLKTVVIEDFVWIGTRAMIMPGVTIKKGSVIASGAIVTRNVEENTVVAGVPARVIKVRINPSFDYQATYQRLFQ